jgi:glycerophosphoryl diester phosphodiesterase
MSISSSTPATNRWQLTEVAQADLQRRNGQTQVMKQLDPSYDVAMLWSELPADWEAVLDAIPASAIHLHYRHLSFALLDATRQRGVLVRVWTCNAPELLAPFWDQGLAGVITDNPTLFLS